MKLKFVAAAASALLASGAAFAGDQSVAFTGKIASFSSLSAPGTALDGGSDTITFTGLAAGVYDYVLTYSGQYALTTGAMLNGTMAIAAGSPSGVVFFGYAEATGTTPFVLTLTGLPLAGKQTLYSGNMSVTAVPEPETYAMMLAGLGALGFLARRRRNV